MADNLRMWNIAIMDSCCMWKQVGEMRKHWGDNNSRLAVRG